MVLEWVIGKRYCNVVLEWVIGKRYCNVMLEWVIGKRYWNGVLEWGIGMGYRKGEWAFNRGVIKSCIRHVISHNHDKMDSAIFGYKWSKLV